VIEVLGHVKVGLPEPIVPLVPQPPSVCVLVALERSVVAQPRTADTSNNAERPSNCRSDYRRPDRVHRAIVTDLGNEWYGCSRCDLAIAVVLRLLAEAEADMAGLVKGPEDASSAYGAERGIA
jgi:hypothetical protein